MMKPYGSENIELKITYAERPRRTADLILGCLLAVSFLAAGMWCLQGGLYFAGNAGEFFNLILDRLAQQNLRIHDDFAVSGGVSGGFLLASALCAAAFAAVVCFSLRCRLWPVLWAILAVQTGLQLWLPGCPWPAAGAFYLLWAGCGLWIASGGGASPIRMAALALVCAAAVAVVCLAAGRPEQSQSLFHRLQQQEKAVAAMPQGDFSELKELELGDEKILKLTMDDPASYYLKGYTGEVYTGSGWESLDGKTLAEENDLFYWLHQKGFRGYSQMALADALLGESETKGNTLKIEFLDGAHSWLLLPCETRGEVSAAAPLIGDSQFRTEEKGGVSSYTLQAAEPLLERRGELLTELQARQKEQKLQDYLICENSYRKFVYQNYTSLSAETEAALKEVLGEAESLNTAQVKAKILKLLEDFDYDENTAYSSGEGDFLSIFLQDRVGWSVHYATAAALMFRYYGIPARYAEGYLVTPEDVKDVKDGEPVTIDSGHAHSWMEYYEDGLGWVPFETTGPYIGVMGSDDSVSYGGGTAQNQKPNQKPEKKEEEQKLTALETEIMEHALWILSGLLLLILILLAAAIWLGRRRMRRRRGLRIADDRQAITIMMGYILAVMEKRGLVHRNIPMGEHQADVEAAFGRTLGEEFQKAAAIYDTARYSGKTITAEDRAFVAGLVKGIKKKTKRREGKS